MTSQTKTQNENKKREAFKRFSKMSAAGLAVMTMSAFTNVSVKQNPANVENCAVEKQNFRFANFKTEKSFVLDNERFNYSDSDTTNYGDDGDYGNSNYLDGINYSEHSDYANNYSNTCE
jgi:hypothetical protein